MFTSLLPGFEPTIIYLLNVLHRERENVLFNDALNTFYLRLYGVRHMLKDHSDSEKGNPLPPHRQGFFYMHHPSDRITHTTAFVTPVMEHWLEREIAQWVRLPVKRITEPRQVWTIEPGRLKHSRLWSGVCSVQAD